jgi:uncharacterized membrane protein YoaK (UPF0700 family)
LIECRNVAYGIKGRSSPGSLSRAFEFWRWETQVPPVLGAIAGLVDVIGFLTLKLFAAHVTGNLVLIAALVVGGTSRLDQVLAIPTFVVAVGTAWLIGRRSQKRGPSLGRVLLFVQLVLLTFVLLLSILWHPSNGLNSLVLNITAMIAVAAMAAQYSFLTMVMPSAPSTAVMTGNLTIVTIAFLDQLQGVPLAERKYKPLDKTFPVLASFLAGCAAGAVAVIELGDWAWSIPVVLAAMVTMMFPRETTATRSMQEGEDDPL